MWEGGVHPSLAGTEGLGTGLRTDEPQLRFTEEETEAQSLWTRPRSQPRDLVMPVLAHAGHCFWGRLPLSRRDLWCPAMEYQWRVPGGRWENKRLRWPHACPSYKPSLESSPSSPVQASKSPGQEHLVAFRGHGLVSGGLGAFLVLPFPGRVTSAGCLTFLSLSKEA